MRFQGHVDEVSREEIHGWVIDWDRPGDAVEVLIIVDGDEHSRCLANGVRRDLKEYLGGPATGHYAFEFSFDRSLSPFREHMIEIRTADGGELIANGRRVLHAISGHSARYRPVLVTSRGRTGTTLLMHQFVFHPEIAVADVYPFEIKLAAYYASVLKVMVASKFTGTDGEPDFVELAARALLVGRNPWNRPALHQVIGGNDLERLFRDSVPDRLASLFRGIILDYYGAVAARQDKPTAHLFAEKCPLDEGVRHGIRSMLGDVREIVLVRDPRDFLCSAKAFWHFDGPQALDIMSQFIPMLERISERAEQDTLFVRYEDLIVDAQNARQAIAAFTGLRGRCRLNGAAEPAWLPGHATSASPATSIGRWRFELSLQEVAACQDRFRSYMERFDYKIAS